MDVEAIRSERCEVALSIFDEAFGGKQEQSLMKAVTLESTRIAELEAQYQSARFDGFPILRTAGHEDSSDHFSRNCRPANNHQYISQAHTDDL
jgi:hypothetical protein